MNFLQARREDMNKKTSCFSNIKIFLVSECALMLAQGTVGAYLVSHFAFTSVSGRRAQKLTYTSKCCTGQT